MKFKKSIYAFSSLAMVVAPVATVVACGDDDDDDDNTGGTGGTTNTADIVWRTNNRNNGVQYEAMVDVAKMYNDTHDGGDVKVLSKDDDGGAGNSDAFKTAIGGSDEKAIPNLYLDYPDTAGVIASELRSLEVVAKADVQKTRDMFIPGVVEQNDQIGGLAPGGMYIAPWSKSTEMMALNGPAMYAILSIMDANGHIAGTRTEIDAILANTDYAVDGDELLKAGGNFDASGKGVGAITASTVAASPASEQWGDEIFTESSTLIDFAIKAKSYVPDSTYILGIDSNANFLYANVFGLGGNDKMDDFLFHKASGADNIDMTWLKDKNSDAYKNFETVYKQWKAGIESGAVYVKHTPSGSQYASYGSDQLKVHNMGLSIGSTAGYGYLTSALPGGSVADDHKSLQTNEVTALKVPEKFTSASTKVSLVQGPSLMAVDKSDAENATVQKFVTWLLNDKVADWPATGTLSQGSNLTGAERYNVEASYITPTNDAMASATPPQGYNPAQAVAYETLHSGTSGTYLFDNPVDRFTNLHRSTLETQMAQQMLQVAGGTVMDADAMYTTVKTAIHGAGHPQV